ncbi:MAG: hypothetical protein EBV31_07890 [Verrucomicrobia bacterium]|nr:hypothetical protein [Verrucomicrobiota bacterium]
MTISGTGIPANATIVSITDATNFVISAATTAGSGQTYVYGLVPQANSLAGYTADQLASIAAGSGRLQLAAAGATNAQTVASTLIGTGASEIVLVSSGTYNLSLNLGALSRVKGGTLFIAQPGNTRSASNGVQTSSGTSGSLITDANGTAYVVFGGSSSTVTDWGAKNSGGWIDAPTYTSTVAATTTYASGNNLDVVNSNTGNWVTQTINSLRFNSTNAYTATIASGSTLTLATGGILFGSSAASSTLTGGTVIPGAGRELVIFSSGNNLTINSVLGNSAGGASDVTYRGVEGLGLGKNSVIIGVLANNTYTGNTYISGERVYLGTATTTNTVASSNSNSLTVSAVTNVAVGSSITGSGIPAGTTVTAIAGNVLTLSQNATVPITTTVTFSSGTPFGTGANGNVYIYGNNGGQFFFNTAQKITRNWYIIGSGWGEASGNNTSGHGVIRMSDGAELAGTLNLMGDAAVRTYGSLSSVSATLSGNFMLFNMSGWGDGTLNMTGNNTGWAGSIVSGSGAFRYDTLANLGSPTSIGIGGSGSIAAGFTNAQFNAVQTNVINKVTYGSTGTIALRVASAASAAVART